VEIYTEGEEHVFDRQGVVFSGVQTREKTDRRAKGLVITLSDAGIVIIALSVYLAEVYRAHLERWDDAYITFRYAKHLTDGLGLVWNVGGAPAEGFTSFLHVILLSFGMKLGVDPWVWSLILGVGCVLLTTLTMLTILSRHAGGISVVSAIMVGIFLVDPVTAIHSTSGLETQLFVLLLTVAGLLSLEFFEHAEMLSAILLAVAVVALCLTRPEAVLYGSGFYAALGVSIWLFGRGTKTWVRPLVRLGISGGIVALGGLLYGLWKYSYFGYLLPNPYYVKSGKFGFSGLAEVTQYLEHLGRWFGPLVTLVLLVLLHVWLRKGADSLRSTESAARPTAEVGNRKMFTKALILLAPALIALAYYTTIIHEVGGGFRFSYPTYSLLVLAVAIAVSPAMRLIGTNGPARTGLILLALGWLGILTVSTRIWHLKPTPVSAFGSFHTRVADALKATNLGSQGTIICDAAGVIPYLSGFNQIDRVGLTDNFLSGRSAPTQSEREEYLWSRSADVYIGQEPPATAGASDQASDPKMCTRYVSEILLKRPLRLVESRIFVQEPNLLHERMRRLRDDWELIGELDWPGWEAWNLKSFVYVRRGSPHASTIISKIRPLVRYSPEQVDLDHLYQK